MPDVPSAPPLRDPYPLKHVAELLKPYYQTALCNPECTFRPPTITFERTRMPKDSDGSILGGGLGILFSVLKGIGNTHYK